jgi:exodeoxyribonuclease V alpha subunit
MKGTLTALIQAELLPRFPSSMEHKYLTSGTYGVAVVAYTRRATNNIRKNLPEDLQGNCITIHKLLEYQPVIYEETNSEGELVTKRVFEATRNRYNPLSSSLKYIIIEEASMVSVELYNLIIDATPHKPTFIFLGDIQQLPPVFGSAILGYKMCELPTVELTQVYRQALESPIIRLAHRILSGNRIPATEYPDWNYKGQLKLHPWKKKLSSDTALATVAKFFTAAIDSNSYLPYEDIILIPYNKAFGTDELNKHIASHIARNSNKETYEIIAGFNKHYYSVGDKVLFDKEDAVITKISPNRMYTGKAAQEPSRTLDYWGYDSDRTNSGSSKEHHITDTNMSEADMDFFLEQASNASDSDRVTQSSHIVTLQMLDSDREVLVETASALNSMILGYAITVHKSQGSEWSRVFLVLHQSHATMCQRELLYTAVTRAKQELYVICEPETFTKGIESQRIKGNTLEEKREYFKGKQDTRINTLN